MRTTLSRLSAVFILASALTMLTGCYKLVGPGHVGIKVSLQGSNRGVNDLPLRTGRVWYNPWSSQIFEYPTFVQTAKWTKNVDEGRAVNEEITFTCKEQMAVSADISLSYLLHDNRVPHFYVKFRNDDLDQFTHGFLRNVARDAFNEVGGKYPIESIMGDNEGFIREVRRRLQNEVAPIGVEVLQFGFIGAPRPPDAVIASINAKAQATQLAVQKQNEVQQAQADAAKAVAKAKGEADSKVMLATGEAESNKLLVQSITPQLIEWRRLTITEQAIAKWNGARPLVESGQGSGLLLQLPVEKPQ